MFAKKEKAAQQEFWVATQDLPKSAKTTFYDRLQSTLDECDFQVKVREICAPYYKQTAVGRPGIDPVVYLKMLMIGFFEDLSSERAIARCADSVAIRAILRYDLSLSLDRCGDRLGRRFSLDPFVAHRPFRCEPTDPLTFGIIPVLLITAAAMATWLPARRADRVKPREALRCE